METIIIHIVQVWSVLYTCLHRVSKWGVFFILLWNELLLENAAFAAVSNAAIFQHIWLPGNYTYIDVSVSFDDTTLFKCVAFSQHKASEHIAFDFKQGKCVLYVLPACIDPNSASTLLQSTEKGVGVFRKSNKSLYNQKTVPGILQSTWH